MGRERLLAEERARRKAQLKKQERERIAWEKKQEALKEAAAKAERERRERERRGRKAAEEERQRQKRARKTAAKYTACSEDYYKMLGVRHTASTSDIKKAYKRLALKWHPDRNRMSATRTTEVFTRIKAAYEVLIDATERAAYDKYCWKRVQLAAHRAQQCKRERAAVGGRERGHRERRKTAADIAAERERKYQEWRRHEAALDRQREDQIRRGWAAAAERKRVEQETRKREAEAERVKVEQVRRERRQWLRTKAKTVIVPAVITALLTVTYVALGKK
ncbi:hypothetical protein KIPB_001794 [Kipferlia bialata]|uniref:J domain-containing protein n=1 Tax=Kipferlia bialata TaxID=797122 RepID=A0A9K3CSJ3_9EUKA|nr:hypothetical protein KIPB_001794 [Kipferlia bialata]|eukprot:g1794.t1